MMGRQGLWMGIVLMLMAVNVQGFLHLPSHRARVPMAPVRSQKTEGEGLSNDLERTVKGVMRVAVGSLLSLTFSMPSAFAADPALAGTKADPKYQKCLSQCIYVCTKPKGENVQKSRAECLVECKPKCASTKEQVMKGVPKPGAKSE